jgi:XTP/dITP diphosphohydrolase
MKEITFATGNSGKIATLKSHLSLAGLDIAIAQRPLELIEPQAATATEVAKVKVQQAYDLLQKPVLVDDSSFHIHALGGFPGPYIKYMLETVGVDGIVKFMEGQGDRRAYFMSSLVFMDEQGIAHIFEGKDKDGEIIEYVDSNDHPEAWSELWKIFAPPGRDGKTYSQLSYEELRQHRGGDKKDSAYTQFTDWLKSVY